MAVYLDDFENGKSHLVSDTEDELHLFAYVSGLKYKWFQNEGRAEKHPHYDVTTYGMYKRMVKLGAKVVGKKEALIVSKSMKKSDYEVLA